MFKYEPFTSLGPSKVAFSEPHAPATNWVFSVKQLKFIVIIIILIGNTSILRVLSLQSCQTLCKAVDCSPPGYMGFSRQECWSGLPSPSPGDLPDSGTELTSLLSPTLASRFFTAGAIWEA